jgi:hypothetical protein
MQELPKYYKSNLSVQTTNANIVRHHTYIEFSEITYMSQDSTQNIPQEATKLRKLAKVTARYMEMEQFRDSDHHTGYFCYNCIYFMKPNHCAIVTNEGADVNSKTSGEIAPHGICALWEPNEKEMR